MKNYIIKCTAVIAETREYIVQANSEQEACDKVLNSNGQEKANISTYHLYYGSEDSLYHCHASPIGEMDDEDARGFLGEEYIENTSK